MTEIYSWDLYKKGVVRTMTWSLAAAICLAICHTTLRTMTPGVASHKNDHRAGMGACVLTGGELMQLNMMLRPETYGLLCIDIYNGFFVRR